jgi:putative transposase
MKSSSPRRLLRGGARPPTGQMIADIHANKDRSGVEPICRVLPIAPSTYDAASRRPASARAVRDAQLKAEITGGAGRAPRGLGCRQGLAAAAPRGDHGGRLHRGAAPARAGLEGVRRGKACRTTTPGAGAPRPADLVERDLSAARPNQLGVADRSSVATWAGLVCVALSSTRSPGSSWLAGCPLASHRPGPGRLGDGHLAPAGPAGRAGASLGQGRPIPVDPLPQTTRQSRCRHLGRLPRRRLRQRPGRDQHRPGQDRAHPPARPWKGIDQVGYATLEWVDWFNYRRLLEPIGYVPPAEFEAAFHREEDPSYPARPKHPSLR